MENLEVLGYRDLRKEGKCGSDNEYYDVFWIVCVGCLYSAFFYG